MALDGVSFTVATGELFALLGPNGGGKSTLFRLLCTLLPIQGGAAHVLGYDVARDAAAVRRHLGIVFQHPSLDGKLTVEENLTHHGRLYGLSGRLLRDRVATVLRRLGLAERSAEPAERLSGGLQRRVELAKALLVGADLLLLDEPSTGLDPLARRDFLTHLRELQDADGLTAVLSTHDLEEAERCDRVAILDRGRLLAIGTPEALKAEVGGDVIVLQTRALAAVAAALRARFGLEPRVVDGSLRLERARGHELVRDLMEAFGEDLDSVTVGRPTLADVFVRLAGHALADVEGP